MTVCVSKSNPSASCRGGKPLSKNIDLEQEGIQIKKSCCYFCHQNCGVLAYVKDGKVLAIEGDPAHPVNQGGLCCR